MIFNEFRLTGDIFHALAILLLIVTMFKTRSCNSVSGVTTLLYLITFLCRYMDLLTPGSVSFDAVVTYNTIFKIYFILSQCFILFLIYGFLSETIDKTHQTFPIFGYLAGAHLLNWSTCYFTGYKYIDAEYFWEFSIYLEVFAVIPQLSLTYKQGSISKAMTYYLAMLGSYRGFYILNWIYRYHTEHVWHPLSFYCGFTQTLVYVSFFIFIYPRLNKVEQSESDHITKDLLGSVENKQNIIEKSEKNNLLGQSAV